MGDYTEGTGTVKAWSASIASDYLLASREWAWRMSGLPSRYHTARTQPSSMRTSEQSLSTSSFLHVVGGEPVWTPAGNYVTWRVNLTWDDGSGSERMESAWFDTEGPTP